MSALLMKHEIKSFQVLVAALALATLVIAGISYIWSRQQAISHLQANADRRVDHFSLAVFAPTDKYAYLPNLVSAYPTVIQALAQPRDARRILEANVLLDRLSTETGAADIYLMTPDGLTIASSNWQEAHSFVGNNYAYRPYFIDAMGSGTGKFYGIGVTTGVPGYFISHAVRKGNSVLGVVVVKVDIHDIAEGWNRDEHDVVVMDDNGVIFLSSREEWKYRPYRRLGPETAKQLKETRQYEAALKEPLSVEVDEKLGTDEYIVSLAQGNAGGGRESSYFVKTRQLAASDWSISVMTSLERVHADARRNAMLAVGVMALLILSVMYLIQVRQRTRERRESREALEQAMQALEKEHSALQTASEELLHASTIDPLTGAYNRRFFQETAVRLVSAANRHRLPLSVIMVDVDHFKQINDEHGHPFGDLVLQTLSKIYMSELREDDIFARFGGEEFVIALPNVDQRGAHLVAERLREKVMSHPLPIAGGSLSITVSSGVSQHRPNEKTMEVALKRADEALYKAKHLGRNRVEDQ